MNWKEKKEKKERKKKGGGGGGGGEKRKKERKKGETIKNKVIKKAWAHVFEQSIVHPK